MTNAKTSMAEKGANSKTTVGPARLAAVKILERVEEGNAYASVLLAAQAEQLQQSDRALCNELVLGTLRRQLWLDHLIGHYSNRDPQRLDPLVRIALRLGLYQLRFLSRVPASAAVNESVNLIHWARLRSAEPFVNAVLRRATREPDYNPAAEISDPIERLAVETSHPAWLIGRWAKAFGFDEASAFARANNEVPPTSFRAVNRLVSESKTLEELRSAGAAVSPSLIMPGGWRITGAPGLIQRLARDGRIYVQDESSQLVAHVLDARGGNRVLDVCAAPGSKTTHIADLARRESMPAELILIAGDLHGHRLRTLVSLAAAQNLNSIYCVSLDALQALPFDERVFDRVLVDAPCSGTGTLRRNPEIRWRISPGDIDDLAGRQLRILLNAARMVKLGGRLVYSTCSVEPEENEQVIGEFLARISGFEPFVLPLNPSLITSSGTARVWPHRDGADGFFIAAFERQS